MASSRLRPPSLLPLLLLLLPLCAAAAALPCGAASTLRVLSLPPGNDDCLTPDAVYDAARARLHVVYGSSSKDAFYVYSDGDGGALSRPIKLNAALGVTTTMGERGPKIAVGANASLLHVVWADVWAPGIRVFARSATSRDGGATWGTPVLITPPAFFGIDGLSVVASASHVVVTYHVNNTLPPNATSATWMYTQVSIDHGATWGAPQMVAPTGLPAVTCSMCMTRPRFNAGGELLIAFRSAVGNVRDFYVLNGSAVGNTFSPTRVNTDGWVQGECPMNGPELALAGEDLLVAYMTGDANHVYWSRGAAGAGGAFSGHFPTPANEANERYPTAVASGAGSNDVLLVWNVGPMAVAGTALVKYACYGGAAGSTPVVMQTATLGTSFAGTKATAVATGDGRFVLLTSAR